jgi:hypothetical protein
MREGSSLAARAYKYRDGFDGKESAENIGHDEFFANWPVDGSMLEQDDENPRKHRFRTDR